MFSYDFIDVLALSALMAYSALFLCGPFALLYHAMRYYLAAAILGGCSIFLGVFWFVHTYTHFRWLGLFSAACGLFVLWRTAKTR